MATPMTSLLLTGDPEEVMSCPYNTAHQIIRKRMQFHLVKCKKNYPDVNMVECAYNTVHKVPEPELRFHTETCPDRHKIDKFYFRKRTTEETTNRFPMPQPAVTTEECWDNINQATYEPNKKCETAPILRQLNVESAAKRRDFRYAERQRLQSLNQVSKVVTINEREKAADFAQRFGANASEHNRFRVVDEEESDPYEITSLVERIRMGSFPIRPMDEKVKAQPEETETDTDATISDAENKWQVGGARPKKGCGRGKFIKKTSNGGCNN